MASVLGAPTAQPTNLAALPGLVAYTQALGLEPHLRRAKRGMGTLALSLVWLTLAWRGSGRPEQVGLLAEPLLPALAGLPRLPSAKALRQSLGHYAATALRAAVEAA